MKFETWLELAEYLLSHDLDISDVDVNIPNTIDADSNVTPIECKIEESTSSPDDLSMTVNDVKLLSLGGEPTIKHEISECEINELHVSNFDVLKEACGAGSIQLNESIIHLNICDMNGHTTTNMSVSIDGTVHSYIPLSLVESNEEKIVLSRTWLEENTK